MTTTTEKYYYVTKQGLANLKQYKYVGVDRSILAPYLQVWWTKAVTYLPMTMAPNMVTLIGFFFIIFSFMLQVYYTPLLEGHAPRWVYVFHFISIFVYQTMDAMDGKQARRTQTSSPLGELFDHGCDSITTSLLLITVMGTLQIGVGWYSFGLLMVSLIAFYFAQWEEYYTGVLDLGYFNVTEAQVSVMLLYITTAIMGPSFWDTSFNLAGFAIVLKYLPGVVSSLAVFVTIIENIKKISSMNIPASDFFGSLLPLGLTTLFSILWAKFSPEKVLYTYPIFFYLAIGFLVSNLVGRLVVARVCKMKFDSKQFLILPLVFGFVNSLLNNAIISESNLLPLYCGFSIAMFLHLSMDIIQSFCDTLDIYCLSIKPKGVKTN